MEQILASIVCATVKEVKKTLVDKKCCMGSKRRLKKYLDKSTNNGDITRRVSQSIDLHAISQAVDCLDTNEDIYRMSKRLFTIGETEEEPIYAVPPKMRKSSLV